AHARGQRLGQRRLLAMQREGITPLGVHDSFIVPETNGPKLEEVMHAELAKLDPNPTAQIPAPEKPNFQPHQRDSTKGNYIGGWGGIAWWTRRGPWRRSPRPTWAYLSEKQEIIMAGNVNKVILVGNLGADPEMRHRRCPPRPRARPKKRWAQTPALRASLSR